MLKAVKGGRVAIDVNEEREVNSLEVIKG